MPGFLLGTIIFWTTRSAIQTTPLRRELSSIKILPSIFLRIVQTWLFARVGMFPITYGREIQLIACRMHSALRIVLFQLYSLIARASPVPGFPKSTEDCRHTNNKSSSGVTWRVQRGCKLLFPLCHLSLQATICGLPGIC